MSEYLQALSKFYEVDYTVFQMDSDFELPEIVPTPRSHERAVTILESLTPELEPYKEELLAGIIGRKYARRRC